MSTSKILEGIWEVHKFGGTSVANAECFLRAASIVEEQRSASGTKDKQICVVVSAMGGKPKVTDLLLNSVKAAADRDEEKVNSLLALVLEKHHTCIDLLDPIPEDEKSRLKTIISGDIHNIRDILKTVALMKWQATRISELCAGHGELWSSQILAALLDHRARSSLEAAHRGDRFVFLDARKVIIVEEDDQQMNNGGESGLVLWDECAGKLKQTLSEEWDANFGGQSSSSSQLMHFVATGFIASNSQNVATTLGRDGSDYSAAIFGRLLQSTVITIWTDVDGVLSADPRRVPDATILPDVSFNEAMELAYFGAKVIHPKTMQPAIMASPQIPIYIRNTFNSTFRGSRIFTSSTTHMERDRCICGFSTVEDISLINVEGSGMVGVPGVAKRLFGTLESNGINVVFISQASSEHSITFATMNCKAVLAKEAVEEEFSKELRVGHISAIDVISPCSIIAAVGDGMGHTTGVAGRFFSALGDAKINVMAMAQGCSERNISAVVLSSESTRALRAVHAAFRLSTTTVRVGVIASDELGYALLALLEKQRRKLTKTFDINVHVCAVVSQSENGEREQLVVLDEKSTDGSICPRSLDLAIGGMGLLGAPAASKDESNSMVKAVDGGVSGMSKCLISEDVAHTVIFDCTADESIGEQHPEWLKAGVHVITANNKGLSGSRELRDAIAAAENHNGKMSASYLREVTVGGGLPVISTIRNLLNSGDRIRRMDGILSISMSYIMHRIAPPTNVVDCNVFDKMISSGVFRDSKTLSPMGNLSAPCKLSQAVKEAIALGLMESDPVRDLSNEYTARCLMVLAKELGIYEYNDIEKIQMNSDSLIGDVDELMDRGIVRKEVCTSEIYSKIEGHLDEVMTERIALAAKNGCVPRHISSIDVSTGDISVKIMDVPNGHFFAITPPSNECVRFFTERHKRYPLVIQGPSEGADSTSSALLAELLHLMHGKVGVRTGDLSRTGSSAFLS